MKGWRSLTFSASRQKETEILTISPNSQLFPILLYSCINSFFTSSILIALFLQTLSVRFPSMSFYGSFQILSFQIIFLRAGWSFQVSPSSLIFVNCHLHFKLLFIFSVICVAKVWFYCFHLNLSSCFWRLWSLTSSLIINILRYLMLIKIQTRMLVRVSKIQSFYHRSYIISSGPTLYLC